MSSSPGRQTTYTSSQPEHLSLGGDGLPSAPPDRVERVISLSKHLLCFVFPLTTWFFLTTGLYVEQAPHSVASVIAFTIPFWLVLIIDWLCPKEQCPASRIHSKLFFDGILLLLALLQIVNVFLMLEYITLLRWEGFQTSITSLGNLIGIRFLVGTSSGTSGIVVAHELIHRPERTWQWLGRLLLCTVCYEHFVISHKRGHHQNLGLPDDIATAKFRESFKAYWRRISFGYLAYAWRSEQERLTQSGNHKRLADNQVLQGFLVEFMLLGLIVFYFGWLAALMFVYQALVAIRILEAVNYFQHWGLEDGQFGNSYGWVSPSWISRYALIGLSHHIGHHQDENSRYYEIPYSNQGPVLPYGYFVMNLWVKLFNDSFQKMAVAELNRYHQSGT